jgi:hypothetical protein
MIEIVSELQETGIIQRVGGDLGELSGALADLGTWRLFAVVEYSTNGGLFRERLWLWR